MARPQQLNGKHKFQTETEITPDHQKDAVRWAKGQLKTSELQNKFGVPSVTLCLYRAAIALKKAVQSGLLK